VIGAAGNGEAAATLSATGPVTAQLRSMTVYREQDERMNADEVLSFWLEEIKPRD
jgi:hypothetical protein